MGQRKQILCESHLYVESKKKKEKKPHKLIDTEETGGSRGGGLGMGKMGGWGRKVQTPGYKQALGRDCSTLRITNKTLLHI